MTAMLNSPNRWNPAFLAINLVLLSLLGIAIGASVGSTGFDSVLVALHDEIASVSYTHLTLPTKA